MVHNDVTHVWLYLAMVLYSCDDMIFWEFHYAILVPETVFCKYMHQFVSVWLYWICLYFSDFWDLYATCPSKTAFYRYIHNISYLAVFGFATVIFLWSHNFFQIFPNFLEFFMLHFMLIQYFVNILCYALFALVGFAVI